MDDYTLPKGTFPRSTLTENNARRFIDIINQALETGDNLFISGKRLGLKATTLKHRLSEALLWLCKYKLGGNQYNPDDYQKLRACIRFRFSHNPMNMNESGVTISFYTALKAKISEDTIQVSAEADREGSAYKELINDFIIDDNKNFLILNGLYEIGKKLNDEDMAWIKRSFLTADIEYEVTPLMVKAIKNEQPSEE